MKEILLNNWVTVSILTMFLSYILYLVINRKWEQLRSIGYKMILQAEKVITGTKMGQERFEFVLDRLYMIIPVWLQFFISRESLKEKLQEWFNDIKDYLDNGKIGKSM